MALVVKIILTVIFGYAGLVKIFDPEGMRESIEAYQLIEGGLAVAGAYVIPLLEVLIVVGLWVRPFRKAAGLLLIGLIAFFTIIIFTAYARGLNLECGCFGKALQAGSYWELFVRDGALLVLAVYHFYASHLPKRC
mgnify:CR=1 FL=1